MLLEGRRARVSLPEGAECMLGAAGRCGNVCRMSVITVCPTTAKRKKEANYAQQQALAKFAGSSACRIWQEITSSTLLRRTIRR